MKNKGDSFMAFCGLDFGTSNSTIGVENNHQIEMAMLEGDNKVLRSAIFLDDEETQVYFGETAINQYIEGTEGRLMTSIKSVLGSSLMEQKTRVFNQMKPFSDVLSYFIKQMKDKAEYSSNQVIDSVVLGRPVRFNDRDDKIDQIAEDTLRDIAKRQGFKHIEFQYEPIAAAMAYAQEVKKEQLALIVDIGGGTSDFTLIKLAANNNHSPNDILATAGVHIGGTNFDQKLSYRAVMPHLGLHSSLRSMNGTDIEIPRSYFSDLSTWHKINQLYSRKMLINIKMGLATANNKKLTNRFIKVLENREGHRLIERIEMGKKQLSDVASIHIPLEFIEDCLEVKLEKQHFEEIITDDLNKIYQTIITLMNEAQTKPEAVDIVFFTGGTTQIGKIKTDIMSMFKHAKQIKGDVFSSVGYGLTLDASKRF